MKINNINPQINFKKVIEIPQKDYDPYRTIPSEKRIVNILNGEKEEHYTKEEANQIKEFFKPILKEEKKYKNILFRRYDRRKYIITGKDADDILKIEKYVQTIKKTPEPPKTNYFHYMGKYPDNHMHSMVGSFKENVGLYALEKCETIASVGAYRTKDFIKLDMSEDRKNEYSRICHFEATLTDENGKEETKKLDLKV